MVVLKHPSWARCLVLVALWISADPARGATPRPGDGSIHAGISYQNDTSLPLYYLPAWNGEEADEREAAENPRIPNQHVDSVDPVLQENTFASSQLMPLPIASFDGIDFTGSACHCAPPDTNGQVGETQYVQMVNGAYQIFDKTSGASLAGPTRISSAWAGFGGACETGGLGDPVVLYDQLAKRWVISQFASPTNSVPVTDECIAVSTTSDATGSYYRYGFHLGSNFYDYPHLGVWPDGYYMSMNVFDSGGTTYLGPQPFAFDRAAMLDGNPAAFVSTASPISPNDSPFLPASLDGQTLPALGAPEPFVEFPGNAQTAYQVFHFHADFATPANSTFTLVGSPAAAGFTAACTTGRSCVPQLGSSDGLDGIGDRLMFRLAYRNFGDHEALVGNYTVSANSVTGLRWFELRNVTAGTPNVFQEGTYQPDSDWRWLGSAAMDTVGNLAIGFSASSGNLHPQLRYAGRLAGDPLGALGQTEAHLFDGAGSQSGFNRWGDYSDLSVDPVDDCTFWFTGEYVDMTGHWKTRIGNFKFPNCSLPPGFTLGMARTATSVCAGTPAALTVNVGSTAGFNNPVTFAASGNPVPSTVAFTPAVVSTLPGTSVLQIGNTMGVAAGVYPVRITGTAAGAPAQSTTAALSVFTAAPSTPTQISPGNGSTFQPLRPNFSWSAASGAETYAIQIATDAAFAHTVFTRSVSATSLTPDVDLPSNTTFYWRVTSVNACGSGAVSPTLTFVTQRMAWDCASGTVAQAVYSYGFESGLNGWSNGAGSVGNTWADNTANVHSGSHAWQAVDSPTVSDQRFVSPVIALPSGQSPLTLQFWNKRDIEQSGSGCHDTGMVEASTDGGTSWLQLGHAQLLNDAYTGQVAASYGNPLANKYGWCAAQDWHPSIIDLAAYAGQSVQFRFRLGTDNQTSKPGWWLDDVSVQSCIVPPHTVTPNAGSHGTMAPATPVQVNDRGTTSFTLTPDPGYVIGTASGCGGSLSGNVFTTAPVTVDCTVSANFSAAPPGDIGISISDGHIHAQYGEMLTYTVTVSNPTLTAISNVGISSVFPVQLDASHTTWICLGGSGVTCTASGTGALSDSGVVVPANGSVSWQLSAPVLPNAAGGDVVHTVTATGGGDPNPANNTASDDDILVVFRSGFDLGNDGGNTEY